MNMILIWYQISDFENNDLGMPVFDLDEQLEGKYRRLGFAIYRPSNAVEFCTILQTLPQEDTILHICAHGSGDGTRLGPFTQKDLDRMRSDGVIIKNSSTFVVTYESVRWALQRIYPEHNLIVNMMAVCNSALAEMPATVFLCFNGENNDFHESFRIYPLNNNLLKQLEDMNSTRGDNEGQYVVR